MRLMKKTKKVRHSLFLGFMAVVMASLMTIPALAADWIEYAVTEDSEYITQYEAFTDDSCGLSWDGADTVTMSDATVYDVYIDGAATVVLEGENSVTYLGSDEDITIVGDKDALTEDKPVLNIVGDSEAEAEIYSGTGTLTIEGVTVNVDGSVEWIEIYGDNGVTIDCSKIEAGDNSLVYLVNESQDATMEIIDSVIDFGVGTVSSYGLLVIDNSDVSVKYGADGPTADLEGYPVVVSGTGIELKNMANGEIKEYAFDESIYYAVSGDEDGVFLKAAGTPGYYVQASEDTSGKGGGMPATGDSPALAVFAGAAVCALAAMAFARRRIEA